MNKSGRSGLWVGLLLVLVLAAWAPSTRACAACFGKSDSELAQGMNMGILTLLLVVLFVLSGCGAFFIYLARRAASTRTAGGPPAAVATPNS